MDPKPHDEMADYRGSDLLRGKRALITGGDSGIGRAVAVAFAKEGCDVAIAYLEEDEDAKHTAGLIEREGRTALLIRGDVSEEQQCREAVERTVAELGGLDIRVNAVAPGPVWTPLIPATMPKEKVESFGSQVPMGRAAQPDEIAPSYVFFASERLSSYHGGEVLAPISGETLPG